MKRNERKTRDGVHAEVPQRGRTSRTRLGKLGLSVLVAIALLWALGALIGDRILLRRLHAVIDDAGMQLEVDDASTLLPNSLTLNGVHVSSASGGWIVKAERVVCDFGFLSLLSGSNEFDELRVEGLVVDIPNARSVPPWLSSVRTPRVTLGATWAHNGEAGVRFRQIRAQGPRIRLGEYELEGPLRYEGNDLTLADDVTLERLTVRLSEAQLARRERTLGNVSGLVEASLPRGKPSSERGLWTRARVHFRGEGDVVSLAPWFDLEDAALRVSRARHRTTLDFRHGELQKGQLQVDAERVSLRHGDSSKTGLSGGVKLVIHLGEHEDGPSGTLGVGSLELVDATGEHWATFSDFRARLRPEPSVDQQSSTSEWRMHVASQNVHFEAVRSSIETTLEATLPLRALDAEGGSFEFGVGTLRTSSGQLQAHDRPGQVHEFEAVLRLTSARLSLETGLAARGRVSVRGNDGSMLLDVAGASETLRWTLSMLEDEPFVIRANLERNDQRLALHGVAFESNGISASGALNSNHGAPRGAFLIQAAVPVGVTVQPDGVRAAALVDDDWLQKQLERLQKSGRGISPHSPDSEAF